jgi:cell division protein FtsI (penicillin-binding protein 3)
MLVLLVGAFAAMALRLVVLQVIESPAYARLASQQRLSVLEYPARRGTILDRTGKSLAISVDLQTVWADPSLVENPARTAAALAPVINVDEAFLWRALRGTPVGSEFEYLAHQIQPSVARRVEELKLPGIFVKPEPKRYYPNGRLAASLLGFTGTDGAGLAGLEDRYESLLQGRSGHMSLEEDPSGRPLPQAQFTYERPEPGRSLYLTIDKDIQYQTELALSQAVTAYSADSGTALVLEVGTGKVLAMANVPTFDPNNFSDYPDDLYRNRAVADVYEPGSSYKIVAVSGALQEGVVSPKTRFSVPDTFAYSDRIFHDSHTHAVESMTVTDIIEQSSNIGTIKIGLKLGAEKLDRYVRAFGFGSPSGLDLPGESSGIVRDLEDWWGSTIATVPIGQGVSVTAMQMASAYAVLANDGVWVQPSITAATSGSDGELVPPPPPRTRRVVSTRVAHQMTRILTGVVERGTGIQAQIPGYLVAGKTGTAQKPLPGGGYGNSYIASFGGYVPANDPAAVVLVVLDEPDPIWGGETAAPTFRHIAEFTMRELQVAPSSNARAAAARLEAEQAGAPEAHD